MGKPPDIIRRQAARAVWESSGRTMSAAEVGRKIGAARQLVSAWRTEWLAESEPQITPAKAPAQPVELPEAPPKRAPRTPPRTPTTCSDLSALRSAHTIDDGRQLLRAHLGECLAALVEIVQSPEVAPALRASTATRLVELMGLSAAKRVAPDAPQVVQDLGAKLTPEQRERLRAAMGLADE